MERLTSALKAFVVAGGVLLVAGLALLVLLLYRRDSAEKAARERAVSGQASVRLPAGEVAQMTANGRGLSLLIAADDGTLYLATIDPVTGERLGLLRVVPERP